MQTKKPPIIRKVFSFFSGAEKAKKITISREV